VGTIAGDDTVLVVARDNPTPSDPVGSHDSSQGASPNGSPGVVSSGAALAAALLDWAGRDPTVVPHTREG
jgi:hypothetical protein